MEACRDWVWLSITVQDQVSADSQSSDIAMIKTGKSICKRLRTNHSASPSAQTTSELDSMPCHTRTFDFFLKAVLKLCVVH